MAAPTTAQTIDIPPIISVDDHVVEPPDLWSSRLPAKYRDVGPRVVYKPTGQPILVGGGYIEAPGSEGEPIAWWFYEDHKYSVKRLIAAARNASATRMVSVTSGNTGPCGALSGLRRCK